MRKNVKIDDLPRFYYIFLRLKVILDMVLATEKYSGFDTTEVCAGIEEKRVWLKDNEPEYYAEFVGEDKDIFTLWKEKGYI